LIAEFLTANLGSSGGYELTEFYILLLAFASFGEELSHMPLKEGVREIRAVRRNPGEPGLQELTEDEVADLRQCQVILRKGFDALARGRVFSMQPQDIGIVAQIVREKRGRRGYRLVRQFSGPLTSGVLLAALDHLSEIGPDRLRKCPFKLSESSEERCGQLFLAARRQLYCSREHAAKAMYQRWKAHGSPRGTGKGGRGKKTEQRSSDAGLTGRPE
jgi:hypothetical protein